MSEVILGNINTINISLLRHFKKHHTCVHHVLLLLELEEEEGVGSSCWHASELDVEVLDVRAALLELDEEVLDIGCALDQCELRVVRGAWIGVGAELT
jgi:hypothetical protein